MKSQWEQESRRILREYGSRAERIPSQFYSPMRPGILFATQQRVRSILAGWKRHHLPEFENIKLLEVGCGNGDWLVDFESWGVPRNQLAGLELDGKRVQRASVRLGASSTAEAADIRQGNAAEIPWEDARFDVVLQSTVFSSILNTDLQHQVASEMVRSLHPGGWILWYDFFVDNPRNRQVKGVRRGEIHELFPGCTLHLERVTLAPPLARKLAPLSWPTALFLEWLRVLNTHYMGFFRKL